MYDESGEQGAVLLRRDLGRMSDPAQVWDALRAMVRAANAVNADVYEAALRRVTDGELALQIDAQIMAVYVVGWCVRSRVGKAADDTTIESYAEIIGGRLSRVGRAGVDEARWLLRTIYRRPASDGPMPADKLMVIGCAVAGIALGTSVDMLDTIEQPAIDWYTTTWPVHVAREGST